jgi:hypothetical protein
MIDTIMLEDGKVLLDAHLTTDFQGIRDAQRALAEYRIEGFETVHVAGMISGDDPADELDALGRSNVRLNIQHLVVVGKSAHGMHRAAEHEGSWDGESIPVLTVSHAYDEVMSLRGPRVAILVTGGVDEPLHELVTRLKGDRP